MNQNSNAAQDIPSDTPPLTGEDVRSIGEIIRDTRELNAEQVASILDYQRSAGVKFGEAAIALGLATQDDVLHALARQFNYAFSSPDIARTRPELVMLAQPFGQQAESFRAVRSQILLRLRAESAALPVARRAIAVVSPESGDGKTFLAANLGVGLSQLGGRTLIVDADLRGPRMHEVCGVEGGTGLSGLLIGRRGENVVRGVPGVPNLFVLPVGVQPPNPLELVQGFSFGVLMHELVSKFDHVIVDTPAAQYGADGAVVASTCGLAVIVARRNRSSLLDVQSLASTLEAAHVKILGSVVNEF